MAFCRVPSLTARDVMRRLLKSNVVTRSAPIGGHGDDRRTVGFGEPRHSPEERAHLGVTDGVLRLSAGLEDADDLCEDLEQALAAV